MRTGTFLAAMVLGLLSAGCFTTVKVSPWVLADIDREEYQSIGVLAYKLDMYNKPTIPDDYVESLAKRSLVQKGYMVLDRSKVEQTFKELRSQQSDMYDSTSRVPLGGLKGAQAILYIITSCDIRERSTTPLQMTAELILVEANATIGQAHAEYDLFVMNMGCHGDEVVAELMESFPENLYREAK